MSNNLEILIAVIVLIVWVGIVMSSGNWLGTKIGDVLIYALGISSLYGMVEAVINLVKWITK